MAYVTWEDQKLLKIEASDFSYTEDMFDSTIEITIFPNQYKDTVTSFINNWGDVQERKDVVMYYKDHNNKYRYYHLVEGVPSIINNDRNGVVSSCKLKFKSMKEISRPLKISEFLKS